ncbi:MAG: DUF4126 family protein [Anaerolineae bacterium]|nr:DUF4126 family protein [Anaerolineae bacterium]
MELILSAIAAGGLVGAADQYLALLLIGVASKVGWISLGTPMSFMGEWWFIAISAVFWLVTLAPAYASMLSPGVMNVINSISRFLSGFLVPLSAGLVALASAGVIASMDPQLEEMLNSLRIFTGDGGIGATGWVIGGSSAAVGVALTGMRAIAKPAASAHTGTTGTIDAPIFATIENVMTVVLMVGAYVLATVDPWLIVALLVVIVLVVTGMLIFAIHQLVRLRKGIGRVLYLSQTHPKAGLAVLAEFLIWGSGWLTWETWGRGIIMLLVWAVWIAMLVLVQPLVAGAFAFFPPAIPVVVVVFTTFLIVIFLAVGFGSAMALMKDLEEREAVPVAVVR